MKSCPFCGDAEMIVAMVEGSELGPDHYFYCGNCSAHGPRADTREDALRLWNRTALPVAEGNT